MPETDPLLDPATSEELERLAADFAHMTGIQITAARERTLLFSYKTLGSDDAETLWSDPVTEVNRDVEQLIRAQLTAPFPDHTVIGDKMEVERQEGGFV